MLTGFTVPADTCLWGELRRCLKDEALTLGEPNLLRSVKLEVLALGEATCMHPLQQGFNILRDVKKNRFKIGHRFAL